MSSWQSIQFEFKPFEALKPPLQSALVVLQTAEAILEALLDLIRAFLIDLTNPLRALIALILAAIRAIINQLKSTGFSYLLVHPDFGRQDFGAVIESVSGGYRAFESKVVSKFFDQSDLFRPDYPSGSAVAMVVFYVGAESPGDLLQQLFALLRLIKHPSIVAGLPAPVELKVRPVLKSDSAVANVEGAASIVSGLVGGIKRAETFGEMFGDVDRKLCLEWRMPTTSAASNGPNFVNALVSFYNSFRFPNFLVERTDVANGEAVFIPLKSTTTSEKSLKPTLGKYNFPTPITKVSIREPDGSVFRHYKDKFPISSEAGLVEGQLTGTYAYVDDDSSLEHGKTYYYRVRAYFGEPSEYLNAKTTDDMTKNSLVRREGNIPYVNYGKNVTMGPACLPRAGFVPRPRSDGFNVNENVLEAVEAGLLLNFEFPSASASDPVDVIDQKAGWGSLSVAGGQVGPLKTAFTTSDKLRDNPIFKFSARRIANLAASNSYNKPQLLDLMASKWKEIELPVHRVLNATFTWGFVGVIGGVTKSSETKINDYLARESSYQNGGPFDGPYPTFPVEFEGQSIEVSVEDRNKIADFIRLCLAVTSNQTSYLAWHTVSLGDVFPALVPFIYDFEQFILSLLKALNSIIKEIEAIIENIIAKIQQLEQILETILNLIDLLNVEVSVSVLGFVSTNGSASGLAQALMESEDKPGSSPFGLHSGIVMCAGGPGEGFIAAIKALGFILGF